MHAKHTPGPWVAKRDLVFHPNAINLVVIAECGIDVTPEQAAVNAETIALLPELLELAIAIMRGNGQTPAVRALAAAALAKLRGE